ncbi:MotA/TolQ/ExbB proton channel family protein [Vibrio marisflavi]|uniref:Tol-Pal system protein TolQ n=1 Tax=Vibrio marisflavi CECT 7928 TaxID=634439 RepID=A0ABM9A4E9_9VIBR|nr:MotA/TolQ/ExbB proton channel family protein [Vibrio marisflavi]CAH0539656.1 Tol-Pal system protein TolQ [Vibrio marisflavi CECT 7928]
MNFASFFHWLGIEALNIPWLESLHHFMLQGGQILWWLAGLVFICWLLIVERYVYILVHFPKERQKWVSDWLARDDHNSWYATSIRDGWLGKAHIQLQKNLNIIKVLVSICPMLGLLGTVTGMISVFDVMATQGSSDPKLMASGISLATLPTLAGMVAALAGMFVHARLSKKCRMLELKLEKSLRSRQ